MPKIRLILEADYEFDRESFRKQPNPNGGEDIELTDEQVDALTDEEMLELDRQFMVAGEYSLEELIGACGFDLEDDVKLEIIKER